MTLTASPVRPLIVKNETMLRGLLAVMLGISFISFIEPSPYDCLFVLLVPAALSAGLTLSRVTIALTLIVTIIVAAEFASLVTNLGEPTAEIEKTPTIYTVTTTYLFATGVLFAFILSRHTSGRLKVCLDAYAFSCVLAGIWGILSYLNIGGLGDREPSVGRIAASFKDPNVFGSYCVMGTIYLMQSFMIGGPRFRALKFGGMLVAACGVLLSFSRGSTVSLIISVGFLLASTYWTTKEQAIRTRVVTTIVISAIIIFIGGILVSSDEHLREIISIRAQVVQEYDGGDSGRFGQQLRSIPMLLDRPFGLGPYRFPFYFGLQPHNTYINAFAEAGWIGGAAFAVLVLTTSVLAIRLALRPSPFQRHAQVVCPALLCYFLQAFQIDIDHWRSFFLMLGAVWGMESARLGEIQRTFK